MPTRFEVEVLTHFRSVGLSQIANEARTALQNVANAPGLSSAQRVTQANAIRATATRAIDDTTAQRLADVRASGLKGNQLAAAENAVKTEASNARRAVTVLFNEVTKATSDLGRRIAQAVRDSGKPILSKRDAARAAQEFAAATGGGGGKPPTPPPTPAAPYDPNDPNDRAAKAKALQSAKTRAQLQLEADQDYLRDQEALKLSKQRERESVAKMLASNDAYIRSSAETVIARRQGHAKARELAVADERLKRANLDLARASAQEAAERFRRIAGDRPTIVARAEGDIQQQRIRAAEQSLIAGDPRALRAQQVLARAQAAQTAGIQTILAADARYQRAQVQISRAKAQQQAAVQGALSQDAAYIRAQQGIVRAKSAQQAAIQAGLVNDRQYARSQAVIARAKAQQAAAVQEVLASDRAYASAQARITSAKAQQRAATQAALASDSAYISAQISTARAKAQQQASIAEGRASDTAYISATARAAAARSQETAAIQAALAADQAYIASTAAASAARKSQAVRATAAEHGIAGAFTRPISELRVENAIREKVQADLQGAAVARTRAAAERNAASGVAQASAARRAAERELNAAIHRNAQAEVRAAIRGDLGGEAAGTRFQRLQARFQAGGSARLPTEFQRLGQFTGSRALTTIGYGVAGTALYGSLRAIGEMVREAEELDRILNQIEAQLEATDSAGQFPQARQGILDIARATGAQADQIASVQFQFQGAFRNAASGQIDVQEALKQTEAAIKVTAITGLSLNEVLDSLTATAKTFKVDISDIGDAALGVQERFGVLARETITFVADLAPVAQQIGLSLEDTASLAGVAQQVSGRSGAALAEGFGRILPQLQEVRTEILQIYNLPQLKDKQLGIAQAFGAGDTGVVFKQLVQDYASLSEQQQQFVINLLGGRREAQVLIPVLQQSSVLTQEWAKNAAGLNEDTGKTNEYFADLRQTVQNTQDRMVEAFKQIGEALFRAGLADGLKVAANAAAFFADGLGLVFDLLEKINSIGAPFDSLIPGDFKVFDDLPGKLLLLAITMGSVNKAFQFFSALLKTTAAAQTAETAASVANAAANTGQATASGLVVVAKGQEAAAVRAAMAADAAETASSTANAAANAAQAGASRVGVLSRVGGLFTRGGAAAASGLGVAGLVAAGGLVVGNEYLNQRSQTQDLEDRYIEQLKTYSNAQLRQISEQTTDFWGRVGNRFFGTELPEELAAEQLVRNESAEPAANITSLLANEETKLIRALKAATGDTAEDVFRAILEVNKDRFSDTKLDDILGASLGYDDLGNVTGVTGVDEEDITPDKIRELLTAAQEDGDALAAMALEKINDFIQNNAELAELLGLSLASDVEKAAIESAGGEGAYALQKVDDARKEYEGGRISAGAFLRKLEEARAATELQASNSDNAEDDAAFFEADKQAREFVGQLKLQRIESLGAIADLLGGGDQDERSGQILEQQIGLITQFLGGQEGTQAQRFEQVPELIGLLREKFERDLELIADDAERARVEAEGFLIPPELRAVLVEQQLVATPEISAAIQEYAELAGVSLDKAFQDVARLVVETNQSVQEITLRLIRSAIAKLKTKLRSTFAGLSPNQIEHSKEANKLAQDIAGLEALIPEVPGADITDVGDRGYLGGGGGATDDGRNEAKARELAQIEVERARAEGDPERLAQLDLRAAEVARKYAEGDAEELQAEADRIRALNEIRNISAETARARIELFAAEVARDPVRSARAQVQLAYIAIAQARGTQARIQAQIQMVNAERQLITAQQDVTYAWLEGVEQYFNLIGDSVRAAEIGVQLAQQKLADVLADAGSGDAERTRARTQAALAEEQLKKVKFDDQIGDIDYLLEMEKISIQQAIRMLEAMLQIPEQTEEMTRTLERRIKSLREELGRDYQFNLPSNIAPTLYEVRRLSQTPEGQGYNTGPTSSAMVSQFNSLTNAAQSVVDNRQITIEFNANNIAEAEQIANYIVEEFSRPTRFGTAPRAF